MPEEVWLPVPLEQYADIYEVSDLGRVRRSKDSTIKKFSVGYALKPRVNVSGHRRVALQPGFKNMMVHRLVLGAFVGPCPEGMEGCHNDGDPSNNALSNLRWDTRSANQLDRTDGWKNHRGEKNGRARLTAEDVRKIRADPRKAEAVAPEYGVHSSTIRNARRGTTWRQET